MIWPDNFRHPNLLTQSDCCHVALRVSQPYKSEIAGHVGTVGLHLGDDIVKCLLLRQNHLVAIEREKDQHHCAPEGNTLNSQIGFLMTSKLEIAEKHSATHFGGFPKHKRAFPHDITRGD